MNARFAVRLFATAVVAALVAAAAAFVAFVLLLPAFVHQGPAGPVEPSWLGSAIALPSIALVSAVAGRSLARSPGARVASSVALGVLIGLFLNLAWLGNQLTHGLHVAQPLSAAYVSVLMLAALASVVGFASRVDRAG